MTGRRSRWFPHQPRMWTWSTETHLLLEDFNNNIVPYRNAGDAYQVSTHGILHWQIQDALELWDGGGRDGADNFVHAVASSLLTDHQAWLEVTFDKDHQNRSPFRVFQAPGVKRTATGRLIQEIPRLDEPNYRHEAEADRNLQQVEIDGELMVSASLPNDYPSPLLMKVIRELAEIDPTSSLMPTWAMEQMTGQRRDAPPYDPNEATRTERLRVAQAALPIGWTAREIYYGSSRHLGNYYYYWRELRFLHFRSSMRERAEEALHKVLTLARKRCGFDVSVTASGLYTPPEVEELIRRFEAGEIPFSALNDIIFERADGAYAQQRCVV